MAAGADPVLKSPCSRGRGRSCRLPFTDRPDIAGVTVASRANQAVFARHSTAQAVEPSVESGQQDQFDHQMSYLASCDRVKSRF